MSFRLRVKADYTDIAAARVRLAGRQALSMAAEHILEEANRTVPIEEGTLGRSGAVAMDVGELVAQVGYNTPYARRQHEETRYRHDPGRRAKWLELTAQERLDAVRTYITASLKGAMS